MFGLVHLHSSYMYLAECGEREFLGTCARRSIGDSAAEIKFAWFWSVSGGFLSLAHITNYGLQFVTITPQQTDCHMTHCLYIFQLYHFISLSHFAGTRTEDSGVLTLVVVRPILVFSKIIKWMRCISRLLPNLSSHLVHKQDFLVP